MIQFVKKASVALMVLALTCGSVTASGKSSKSKKTSGFNWNPVIEAIIQVESGGNAKAISGNSVGAMQITPILVKDCNEILKKQKSKKRFSLNDRYSVAKSKEMFLLIQSYHNPENSIEKAIRAWNGGPNYSMRATNRYFKKVMGMMK